ncbi:unnamed protein product, partial [Pylaiella littoralis]
ATPKDEKQAAAEKGIPKQTPEATPKIETTRWERGKTFLATTTIPAPAATISRRQEWRRPPSNSSSSNFINPHRCRSCLWRRRSPSTSCFRAPSTSSRCTSDS